MRQAQNPYVAVDTDAQWSTEAEADEKKSVTVSVGEVVSAQHQAWVVCMTPPVDEIGKVDHETDEPQ